MKRLLLFVLTAGVLLDVLPLEAQPAGAARKTTRRTSRAKAAPALDVAVLNDGALAETVGPRSSGAAALRAQVMLDRAHFSVGEIDGQYGPKMRNAVTAFQSSRNLPTSGVVDEATWKELNTEGAPAVVPLTLGDKDVAGPFEKVPEEMQAKASLKTLGYESAEEKLGEQFHVLPALLKRLNAGKDLAAAGTEIMVPNVLTAGPGKVARVEVIKDLMVLRALSADDRLIAQYPVSFGLDDKDPLPIGEWKVTSVARDPVFHYNPALFWDADPTHAKAKIPPGPNNPVGVVWIDISKEHYGLHGTPTPTSIGVTRSHGCVRLTNWDVIELAAMVTKGTPVVMKAN